MDTFPGTHLGLSRDQECVAGSTRPQPVSSLLQAFLPDRAAALCCMFTACGSALTHHASLLLLQTGGFLGSSRKSLACIPPVRELSTEAAQIQMCWTNKQMEPDISQNFQSTLVQLLYKKPLPMLKHPRAPGFALIWFYHLLDPNWAHGEPAFLPFNLWVFLRVLTPQGSWVFTEQMKLFVSC